MRHIHASMSVFLDVYPERNKKQHRIPTVTENLETLFPDNQEIPEGQLAHFFASCHLFFFVLFLLVGKRERPWIG